MAVGHRGGRPKPDGRIANICLVRAARNGNQIDHIGFRIGFRRGRWCCRCRFFHGFMHQQGQQLCRGGSRAEQRRAVAGQRPLGDERAFGFHEQRAALLDDEGLEVDGVDPAKPFGIGEDFVDRGDQPLLQPGLALG